jgi:predicted ATPase/DNA-binding SARP family transcriptional activator
MLHIHLFGYLRLLVDGQPYRFQALPKTTSLLAYLLLRRDAPVTRDHLAYLLWDDVPEAEARANLRRHLHDLTRALPKNAEWLSRDAKSVQWNPAAPVWLDIAEFERLCQDTGRLTEAIALYTGDLLQALYDDWVAPERERLRTLYLATLGRLIVRERERGDLDQAQVYARQLLSQDPLREDIVRDSMLLRHERGDRAGAMQLYQQFAARLAEELGVAPMPETRAVYEQIASSQAPASAPLPPPSLTLGAPSPAPPHNLPARLTSFVGRREELADVCRLLGAPGSSTRLLTITGPGGTGKTRLALETAAWLLAHRPEQFPNGLYFVGLSAVTTPERVPAAIAEALEIRGGPNLDTLDALKSALRDRQTLLLLDNFEHLLDAAPVLAELLTAAPHLRLLVTSQAVLHLYGEQEYPLPPLPLPDPAHLPPLEELLNYAAVRLFVERVQAVQPHFRLTEDNAAAVANICHCLDGMPLPLELAAARSKLFSPAALLGQLTRRLRFLSGQARNLPARHQTLRATIDWSYQLLTPEEQTVFAAVAFFAGSFTFSAVQALFAESRETGAATQTASGAVQPPHLDVTGPLLSLVDKNMLRALPATAAEEPRFRMLQTLREYGLEKLAQLEEAPALQRRYAAYYVDLSEQGKEGMRGPQQSTWMQRLRQEDDNLTAALEWLGAAGTPESDILLARLLIAISRFWTLQGRSRELRGWLDRAATALNHLPAPLQVTLLNELGNVAVIQGDYAAAERCHQQALSLARASGDSHLIAHTLHFLASAAGRQGHYAAARPLFEESLALYRQLSPVVPVQVGALLNNLAIVHKRLGEHDAALARLEEALNVKRASGDRLGLPASLSNIGNLLILQRKPEAAAVYLREALAVRQELQDRQGMLYSINEIAALAVALGRYPQAATLYAAADALHDAMAISRTPDDQTDHDRDLETIRRYLGEEELADCQATGARLTIEAAARYALAEATRSLPSPRA